MEKRENMTKEIRKWSAYGKWPRITTSTDIEKDIEADRNALDKGQSWFSESAFSIRRNADMESWDIGHSRKRHREAALVVGGTKDFSPA